MQNKIQIFIAKTITISVALGTMSALVLHAHQEQKNISFFQSSKIVVSSDVKNSLIGTTLGKIDTSKKETNVSKDEKESFEPDKCGVLSVGGNNTNINIVLYSEINETNISADDTNKTKLSVDKNESE